MSDLEEDMEVDYGPVKKGGRKLTRADKSRIAAKNRRDKEMAAMDTLIHEMPIADDVLHKMDKASVIRLAISYIKIKRFVQKDMQANRWMICENTPPPRNGTRDHVAQEGEGQMMLNALNGFLIYVNRKGTIRFISATVEKHLGLHMENLIGRNIIDYIHPSDQKELAQQLKADECDGCACTKAICSGSAGYICKDNAQKVFYIRMKFNLAKPGNRVMKQGGYTLVQWTGKLKKHISSKTGAMVTDGLLCICRPMQTSPMLEIRMDGNMFMSRHDLGMTFTFCDSRIITLVGYEPNELVGKTAYHFHNPIDAPKVSDCHQNLIVKGTSVSKYYRFMGKTENWVWLQTRATIIYNTNNKPQYIVCMNYVISEEEGERYLMLEEHKHASTNHDNPCLTLPDNTHHHDLHQHDLYKPDHTSLKITELEDENLTHTACLNSDLDTREKEQILKRSATSNKCGSIPNDSELAPVSVGPCYQQTDMQLLLNQSTGCGLPVTGSVQQPVTGSENQGSELSLIQAAIPQTVGCTDITDLSSAEMLVSSVQGANLDPNNVSYPDSPETNVTDLQTLDLTSDNAYSHNATGSCHSNQSYSEDGGYESQTSPYSASYMSPPIVSPFHSDAGSEQGFTPETGVNPLLIQGQNCNFGVGYSGANIMATTDGSELQNNKTSDMFGDTAAANITDAENILDELLQSFNRQGPSDNLDTSIAAIYSTMESLTSESNPSLSTNAKFPSVTKKSASRPHPVCPSPVVTQPIKKASSRSMLRKVLTMPEDDIPKQPLSFLKSSKTGSNNPNGVATVGSTKFVRRTCQGSQIDFGVPFNSISSLPSSSSMSLSSKNNLNCQNNLMSSANTYQKFPASLPKNTPQDQQGETVNEDLDLSSEMPDDISDFALQYLDSITYAQAQAVIADLTNEAFMDTSENDVTKDFLNSLESQCPENGSTQISPLFNACDTVSVSSAQSPFSCASSSSISQSLPASVSKDFDRTKFVSASSQRFNGSYDSCNPHEKQSHDHVYYQSSQRLNGHHHNNQSRSQKPDNPCLLQRRFSSGSLSSSSSVAKVSLTQTQTANTAMPQLEHMLRTGSFPVNPCSNKNTSTPFLQQLLTGELTQDRYIQMEQERCCKGRGVRPQ